MDLQMGLVQDPDLLEVKNEPVNVPVSGRSSKKKRVVVVHDVMEKRFGSWFLLFLLIFVEVSSFSSLSLVLVYIFRKSPHFNFF